MGAADSFDGASTNQGQLCGSIILTMDSIYLLFTASGSLPPAPQMTVSSIAARPRSSLVRAGSLTETKLSANALRRSGGPRTRKDSYDSGEWSFCLVIEMSDLRFTVSSVESVARNGEIHYRRRRCFFLIHFCPQPQAPVAPRNVEIAINTIVPHILLRGRHCRRNFRVRDMSLPTVVAARHPLERDQVPPLLIVSNIRPQTTRPDCFSVKSETA